MISAGRGKWRGRSLLRLVVLCAVGLGFAAPFVWMICASFKTRADVDNTQEIRILPRQPTAQNYPIVLNIKPDPVKKRYLDVQFRRWYFNSFWIAMGITILQVLTSSMAAYAFARIRWKGRDTVFLLYLATMMIPGIIMMIPSFQIMVWLGFRNTYHGLIIPAAFSAFGTFLLRQFMLSIPSSLDEAATIDGANHWQVFWQVIVPLARPGLIALAIITFLGAYQSFFWPLIMVDNEQLYPMSVGLLSLDSSYGRQTELIMAAAVMNVAPLIIIFAIFQRFLVKGLQMGAVKG